MSKQSLNKVHEFYVTSIAYVLLEHGYEPEKIKKIIEDIQDVADSMVRDYINFCDIRKVINKEYDFEIEF